MNKRLHHAKTLRKSMTDAERKLWYLLRAHRLCGYKFKRQHPVGPYIVDFISPSHRVVVEVDGGQHLDSAGDSVRDLFLTAKDFRVLRFWNDQVLKETDLVLQVILDALPALSPDPSPTVVGEGNSQ